MVLIDFWTYTCINCLRTLPYIEAWSEEYRDDGLVVVGVHSPEFPFEREADNVSRAIDQNGLTYPVVQDNELGTWDSFQNQYWPAKYLIDTNGRVRYAHFGEGDYEQTERAIRSLLAENGDGGLGRKAKATAEVADPGLATPETYLGSARGQGWVNGKPPSGTLPTGETDFGDVGNRIVGALPPNGFAFQGRWDVEPDGATALEGGRIDVRFRASQVYPGDGLARPRPRGPGPARRPADRGQGGGQRRRRRHGDGRPGAPLPARRPRPRRGPRPQPRVRGRPLRLRVHVRLMPAARGPEKGGGGAGGRA